MPMGMIIGSRIALTIAVLGLWQLASGRWIPEWTISSPTEVSVRLYDFVASGEIWPHLSATLQSILIGYPLGVVVGVVLGYVLGRYRVLGQVLGPFIIGIKGVPTLAFAPLFIVWFGIGLTSKVAIVMFTTFFFCFFNTYAGLRHMDEDFVSFARLLGAKGSTLSFGVILPAISPDIFTGIRSSAPLSVIGATIGEFVAARAGIGVYVRQAASVLDMAGTFVGVIILVLLVLMLDIITSRIEQVALNWMPKRERGRRAA